MLNFPRIRMPFKVKVLVPTVSVIIPAYNAEQYIAETLASVENQTLKDIEIIVVDDGSKDNTAAVVQAFPSVRYVRKSNGGVSAARNHGASLAHGEFLAFLDADDIWHPDKLRQQVQALSLHPECNLCRTHITTKFENLQQFRQSSEANSTEYDIESNLAASFLDPYFTTSTVMVRREAFDLVGGFDTKLRIAEDIDFYLKILAPGPMVLFMKESLVYKRPVVGSLGDDSAAGYVQLLAVYHRFLAEHPHVQKALGRVVVDKAFYHLYTCLARSMMWVGRNQEARSAALNAMKHGPNKLACQLFLEACVPIGVKQLLSKLRR